MRKPLANKAFVVECRTKRSWSPLTNTLHVWLETILGAWVADLQAYINNKVKAQRTPGKMYLSTVFA